MSDFSAKIKAILDTKDIPQQIKGIEKNTITLKNLKLDTSKLVSDIQAALNHKRFTINLDSINMSGITSQMQKSGADAGNSFLKGFSGIQNGLQREFSGVLNKIDLVNGGLGNMRRMLQGAGFNKSSISAITDDLNKMEITVEKISTSMAHNGNISMNIQGVDSIGNIVSILREYNSETGNVINSNKRVVQSFTDVASAQKSLKNIDFGISSGSFQADIDLLSTKLKAFEGSTESTAIQAKANLESLQTAFATMGNTDAGMDARIAAFEEFNRLLPVTRKQINEVATAEQTLTKSTKLSNDIQTWMNNNREAAAKYGDTLKDLQSQLKNNTDKPVLNNISQEFSKIKSEAQAAGLTTNTFAKSLKTTALQVLGLSSAVMVFQKAINIVKQGVQVVIELDDAMVDLKKTTTMSASELSSFYSKANESAKKLGVTTQEIIQSAADWSRLGYSDKKSATKMAELSAQFNAISPGATIDETTKGLISSMKAYKIEADDVLDGIMSKINIVGNTAATSNKDIIVGLQDSASAMAAMGSTLEENIALFTAAQEITQDASKVGNALRSISMRVRGYDEETEALSDELANISGEVVDLTKTAKKAEGVSLFTDASQTEYKTIYQYLHDISEVYDDLSAKNQQELMEKLFGKNRASIGQAILQNMTAADKAMDNMANSAGNAEAEMAVVTESITFHLNELKTTWEGIAMSFFNSDSIKLTVDVLTKLSEVIKLLIDNVGALGTVMIGGGIAAFIKNFD